MQLSSADELSGEARLRSLRPPMKPLNLCLKAYSTPSFSLKIRTVGQNLDLSCRAEAVRSEDIATHGMTTLEGNDLEVMVEDSIKVNEATILLADVEASNGIIHVIDQVIIPPELAATCRLQPSKPQPYLKSFNNQGIKS
jgi:hypothetical protein